MRHMIIAFILILAMAATAHPRAATAHPPAGDKLFPATMLVLRQQIMQEAAWAMRQTPVTVTDAHSPRSAGGRHDYYSEGDYWWPDPRSADSPYIQRDGMSNPDNFTAHRLAMVRFSRIVGALASAYRITGDTRYVEQAMLHCKAWFVDTSTYMNPSLQFAQAIKGRATGRGIGIIDSIQLMEVVQGLTVMQDAAVMGRSALENIRQWFIRYLQWLTSHAYGKDEMNAANNHGTCWVMQVAAFARFTGDTKLMDFCRDRYKNVLLPNQMAPDGSFPLELKRTKPYGYSIFNLDAMTTICRLLSTPEDNLFLYSTPDGRSIKKAMDFLYPYIAHKEQWPFTKDVMYWNNWPVAQPFLLFGAEAFGRSDWFDSWRILDHDPQTEELIRNLPVRHPLIWLSPAEGHKDIFIDAEKQTELMLQHLAALRDSAGVKTKDPNALFSPRTLEKGQLKTVSSRDWTSGFFPGVLWILYGNTHKNLWRQRAEAYTALMEREKTNGDTHDMGFKIYSSYGKGYEITNDPHYKEVILQSARTLSTRFSPLTGCIRSWDHHRDRWGFPVIIDNMMNLELLFAATRISGDSSFYKIAVSHANTTLRNHFRPDYSSFHVVDYDTITGKPVKKMTWQGLSDSSAWARGQAWGLYGFTMCYRETGDTRYLRQAENIARYILKHPNLPQDKIPYWDFNAPSARAAGIAPIAGATNDSIPRDASAGAVIASALYELSRYSANGKDYKAAADTILDNLSSKYRSAPGANEGFILAHSTGSKPFNSEVDVPLNYADYYYLEALTRSEPDWVPPVFPRPVLLSRGDTLPNSQRMAWWRDARFGMFIHWGVYAQLAGVYDGHEQARGGAEWIMNMMKIPVGVYQSYAAKFNPIHFDADQWVRMAKDAGMKYIVITAKHHDGFAMFRTAASKWNIVDATPYGKDVLKPLAAACKKYGIRLGFYYSQAQDWNNPGGTVINRPMRQGWPNPDSSRIDAYTAAHEGHWDPVQTSQTFSQYIDKVAVPQVRELLTNYGDVAVLWWDTPANMTDSAARKLQDLLALQPGIITNDRLKRPNFLGDYKTPEQRIPRPGDLDGLDWETCMTMNGTWGYRTSDSNWKSATTLIRNLADIASKGGNYLLNIGPMPDGRFPGPSVEALKEIGTWMKINGEAIYGTAASPLTSLPWGRCTQKLSDKGHILYLIVFDWPTDGHLEIPGLQQKVLSARLLQGRTTLHTERTATGLHIDLPPQAPDKRASVIRLDLE